MSLLDLMILYCAGYAGACVIYSFLPDRIFEYKSKKKSFAAAFGSGVTVTGHIALQGIVLSVIAAIIG